MKQKALYLFTIIAISIFVVGCGNITKSEAEQSYSTEDNVDASLSEEKEPLTEEMAYNAIYNYIAKTHGWDNAPEDVSEYLETAEATDDEYVIYHRSYTGAFTYYYVNKETGDTHIVDVVPALDIEEDEEGSINVYDYL